MTVLKVRNLTASPWGATLLEDINIELEAGSILGIIGPNGAGKSSLLHTLAGGSKNFEGSITLGSTPLLDWDRQARAKSLALLPQTSSLNFPFQVEEVVLLGRTPHSSGDQLDRQILDEVMLETDTMRLRDRLYTELSGGERQRVHLARVLAQLWRAEDSETRLLLLDEPSNALDLAHQQKMYACLSRLATDGCAIVVVLHDFNTLSALAEQVMVLDEGRCVASGPTGKLLTNSMFSEIFGVDMIIDKHPVSGKPLVIQA